VYTKIYSANQTENVTFYDVVGNGATTGIAVTRIDKTVPTCGSWTYSPTLATPTSGNVTATLAGSTDAGGSTINTAGGSCTISAVGGSCTVTINDNAGNSTTCTSAAASNIDRTAPTISAVGGTPTAATSGNVTVSITASDT
jgi:hypothetical protein